MTSRFGAERAGSFRWAELKDSAQRNDPELLSTPIMRQQTTLVTLASSRRLQRTSAAGWISPWEAGPLKWKPATGELFMLTCPVLSVGSLHLANWLITQSVTEARLPLTSIKLCFLFPSSAWGSSQAIRGKQVSSWCLSLLRNYILKLEFI